MYLTLYKSICCWYSFEKTKNPKVRETAYNTLVCPQVEYGPPPFPFGVPILNKKSSSWKKFSVEQHTNSRAEARVRFGGSASIVQWNALPETAVSRIFQGRSQWAAALQTWIK